MQGVGGRSVGEDARLGGVVGLVLGLFLVGCSTSEEASAPGPASLAIDPPSFELVLGERGEVRAVAEDEAGRPFSTPIVWSSTAPEVVSVDGQGVVVGRAVGEARIEAEASGKRASASVRVREPRLARIRIEPETPRVIEGESILLEATVLDELGRPHPGLSIAWESDAPLYAEVDAEGRVSGLWRDKRAGITARHGELESHVEVEVLSPMAFIDLKPLRLSLLEDESAAFEVVPRDASFNALDPRPMEWRSEDEGVATVDAEGRVRALSPGETRIVAEAEGKSSWALVEVRPRATRLELGLAPLDIRVGGQVSLEAVAWDRRGQVVDEVELEWRVADEEVAFLLGEMALEGVGPGRTTIEARDDAHGVEASVELVVREEATFHIVGLPGEVWPAGASFQLELEVETKDGERIPARDPIWFSHDPRVAEVDAQGRVKLVAVGQATVGVRAEGVTRSLDRTVAVRFEDMALGGHTSCGLARNGSVWCWGGKVGGDGSVVASWTPELVTEGIVRLRHGRGACENFGGQAVCDVTYALRADGGLEALHPGRPPLFVAATDWVDFSSDATEICGIRADGSVGCRFGALDRPGPVDALSLFGSGACFLAAGDLGCEGSGLLGADLGAWSFAPRPEMPFPLALSVEHGCALSAAGEAICFGANEREEVRSPEDPEGTWVDPMVVAEGIRTLAVAENASFFVTEEGEILWRGDARFHHFSLEVELSSFERQGEIRSVHTGPGGHRCVLLENDRPYCWGVNDRGQAGYQVLLEPGTMLPLPIREPLSPSPENPFVLPLR